MEVKQVVDEGVLVLVHQLLVLHVEHRRLSQGWLHHHEGWVARHLSLRTHVLTNLLVQQRVVELFRQLRVNWHVVLDHLRSSNVPHLRVVPPLVVLLHLVPEVIMVLFEINEKNSDIILAVPVGVAFVSDFGRNLSKRVPGRSHFCDHLSDTLFTEDKEKSISGEQKQIVVVLDLVGVGLRLRDQELLVLEVSNGSADSDAAIHPGDVIFYRYKTVVSDDAVIFVISVGSLFVS